MAATAREPRRIYKLALLGVGCKDSLGRPSKMPCPSYSIPAETCITGSKLAKVPGSVCADCYALKGNYTFKNVQAALYRRFDSLTSPDWVAHMALTITTECAAIADPLGSYFRWHDSGDLQSVAHLASIAAVAQRTPHVQHWLPTREYKIVSDYLKDADLPPNLIVRLSAHMVDGPAPMVKTRTGQRLPVSYVHQHRRPQAHVCPAPEQGNKCASCRHCFYANDTSYHKH
jgi:hypothetical protein